MPVVVKQLKRVELIELSGRIDSNTTAELESAFAAALGAERYCIVLDMKDLDYISARGLRALFSTLKQCKRQNRGDLRLCCIPPRVRGTLDMSGSTPLFKIYDSANDAVESF